MEAMIARMRRLPSTRDLAVDELFNVDELEDMRWDEFGADDADDEDVAAFSPGGDVARPHGHLRALRPVGGAGGSNDPLPLAQVQPEALAVVPQVTEPHAYVGAALRFVANSPPSRALTRLRASLLQRVTYSFLSILGTVSYRIRILMYLDVSCMYLDCILMCPVHIHQDTSRYIKIHLYLVVSGTLAVSYQGRNVSSF
jgi:hypothetical protein